MRSLSLLEKIPLSLKPLRTPPKRYIFSREKLCSGKLCAGINDVYQKHTHKRNDDDGDSRRIDDMLRAADDEKGV